MESVCAKINALFWKEKACELKYEESISMLIEMEKAGDIVLYAGTYSFLDALKGLDVECAFFYFYTTKERRGYVFYITPMGVGIENDNAIFLPKHRHLYKKSILSNCYFGEKDERTGEYFKRK